MPPVGSLHFGDKRQDMIGAISQSVSFPRSEVAKVAAQFVLGLLAAGLFSIPAGFGA